MKRGITGQDVDYVSVVDAYNEAVEKGMKAKKLPTANPYLLAVQKALSDRVYPQFRKRWTYRIGDWQTAGVKGRDRATYEELKRMKASQETTTHQ